MGGFFAKAIGALYKIPLANILGSSGMGIYYLIFPIYSLFITLSSSGVAIALSTEVAKCRKIRHRYNEQKLLRVSLIITFLISLFFTIITIVFSKIIAEKSTLGITQGAFIIT
jgi:stage V sporulation protein B